MLSKETEQSPIPAFEPWMSSTEFAFNAMSTTTVLSKSTPGLQVSSPGRTSSNSVLPSSSGLLSSLQRQISSPRIPVSSPGLPKSSQGLPIPSPSLPLASPGLPTSAILSPSQIKQEPILSIQEQTSSILINELLSRENISNAFTTALQLKNNATPTSTPFSFVVCKREHPDVKIEPGTQLSSNSCPKITRIKEEYPDLCDMVGVDKSTYLEFLNNPILPSISEVEQLLEQYTDSTMSHCRPTQHEYLPAALLDYSIVCKTEPQRPMPPLVPHHDSSLSPSYQASYMDPQFSDEDPSLCYHNDLTPLLPMHSHDLKHREIKSDVGWSHDVSNGGYDSSGPIESPRSTGSLESEEGESRLPTAVENMDDVGVMTSQLEESNRLTFDDDFGSFDVDEKAFKKRRKGLHLWEFLLDVLEDDRYVPHFLYWVDRSKGIFKIEKSQEVAKLWGRRKQRSHMTYEHMSRAMRHYYSSGIMRRIPGKRLMYQFGPRAFATSKSSS